jgi:phosphate starvation-inducible PhoH-like protein
VSDHLIPDVEDKPLIVEFADNRLVVQLCGDHDRHLALIEKRMGVDLTARGNRIAIIGKPEDKKFRVEEILRKLYSRLEKGREVTKGDIEGEIRMAEAGPMNQPGAAGEVSIRTTKRVLVARSVNQGHYIRALAQNELVFGLGPAGTGKTYLAAAVAVQMLLEGKVERLILSRPAVEAGERLGFLPGDMREKIDPYLRPLYDALHDMMPGEQVKKRLETGEIEIAPLAFMRGRTLANSFVILDEAQNTTPVQMKMFLTRLGENSRMAITGDSSQVDLPLGARSGLVDAIDILQGIDGISMVYFTDVDVVRHNLVTRIVRAYDAHDRTLLDKPRRR